MATIKSYTDLSQSKKLAEILPLESADMFYADLLDDNKHKYNVHILESYGLKTFEDTKTRESKRLSFLPCWSLAALLSVVPEEVSLNSFKDGNWNAMVQQNGKMIYGDANNPVDACYEMIIKLHEQNLL